MEEIVTILTSDETPPPYIPPRTPREEYDALFRKREKKLRGLHTALNTANTLRQEVYKLDEELDAAMINAGLRVRAAKKPEGENA